MYIVDTIPLALIPRNQPQILSYFNKEPLKRGSIVEVLLGSRKIKAVVVDSATIRDRKMVYRKSVGFKLKNISRVINPESQVSNSQFRIAGYISSRYYVPLGISLKTILPPFWGKKKYKLEISDSEAEVNMKETEPEFVKTNLKDHFKDYEKLILNEIKKGRQVFLLVAEQTSAKYLLKSFSKLRPANISSSVSNEELYKVWQGVKKKEINLIIGTRLGLFLPFADLGLVIVDDESNEFYKSDMMPRYNGADLAKYICSLYGSRYIFSAVLPRLESLDKKHAKLTGSLSTQRIVSMVNEVKSGNFSILSRSLKNSILGQIEDKKNTIIYVPRRGHANFLLCQKCGQSVKCPNCSVPMVLHKKETSILMCHHCSHSELQPKLCSNCGSYKLKPYGVGTQKVVEELERMKKYSDWLKDVNVLRLDSDVSDNDVEKELEILEEFENKKPSILVTTQIAFSYKYLIKVPFIGIINADALINIPDFRAEESLLRQLYTLGAITDKLTIQTYNPDSPAIKSLSEIHGFINQELDNRKAFSYPPFSSLVKLTFRHHNFVKARDESRIVFEKLRLAVSQSKTKIKVLPPAPAFISREQGKYVWNIILKVPLEIELAERNELLRFIPAGWIVDVDPRHII
ncbi:MAG: primosomal protein N' [Candidatus Paceibacterota bacterium]